jgi:orotate phosphoribosyltransferase-like protein
MSEKGPQQPDLNALRRKVLEQPQATEERPDLAAEQIDMIQAFSQENTPKERPGEMPDIKTLRRNLSEKKGTPVIPLEKIDTVQQEELEIATKQIEIIRGSLQDLAHRIEKERPDLIVFLDLSARVFGTPYRKYLTEIMGKDAPPIRFYNDQDLKGRYLHDEENEDLIEKDFEQIRGKKVFFIDETFSTGKGAVAINEAAMEVGANAYYFALSKDPHTEEGLGVKGKHYDISEETHFAKVEALKKEGRINAYENPIQNLFSRFTTRLYMQDWQGVTMPLTIHSKDSEEKSSIPDANSYYSPPEGMTMEEYATEVSARSNTFVRKVKDKIYEALKDSD